MIFNGKYDKELFDEYREWVNYITLVYLPVCNSENGDFIQLPFEGSIMSQPYMTMQILQLIQMNYRKNLSKKMDKIKMPKRR